MDRPRFTDHLEAIKFICKDFWSEVFKKQIDNLKTNHRGTFVLQDNRFRWLSRMSVDPSIETLGSIQDPSAMAENKAAQAIGMHLYFPCGIIRGALSNLGIPCAVSADISNLPACSFVIRIKAWWAFARRLNYPKGFMRHFCAEYVQLSHMRMSCIVLWLLRDCLN